MEWRLAYSLTSKTPPPLKFLRFARYTLVHSCGIKMTFEYSNVLRRWPQLFSLAQNCELEIRELFNDLISVHVLYDLGEPDRVRARLSDVGKSTELTFTAADLENERQTGLRLKQAWAELFRPPKTDAADSYEI